LEQSAEVNSVKLNITVNSVKLIAHTNSLVLLMRLKQCCLEV